MVPRAFAKRDTAACVTTDDLLPVRTSLVRRSIAYQSPSIQCDGAMHGISDYSILPRERLSSCDGDVRVYLLPQTRYTKQEHGFSFPDRRIVFIPALT
jgi:hypothetical protein